MKRLLATLVASTLLSQVANAGELTLFEHHGLRGNQVTLHGDAPNLRDGGFNDKASSLIVRSGTWEVCEHKDFGGYCALFRRGEYPDLERFNNNISSAREVQGRRGWRDRDRDHYGDGRRDDRPDGWREGEEERIGHEGWRGGGERRGEAVQLFAGARFEGRTVDVDGDVRTLRDADFNDRAGSLVVRRGTWEVCEHADYGGQCVVFGPGRYPFLEGMNDRISSLRRVR
ncbi:beta/gamma crystallin-related protein [Pseudoduganella plicata]|uniref:Beta/gamma crystallin 'Greek key' domain-containing protein n=1 Tax=Pseudoduganella plicata TaxID=321984 RepID=A0A4P7BKG5_9BURK|nr:beta/gamma crystallin-related protein [Pseudoduganella plicata]QBQ38687.1 hypothetical protein E1742_22825 [Pseudoduganella plicata]GGY84271.1 hypothetical protein GCM10007388_16680 [Pseudoduganella plicata]